MSGDRDVDLVSRLLEEFSVDMAPEWFAEAFAAESEIVPLRADLEGVVYRGADAPAQFLAAARDSWERLRFEAREVRRVGDAVLAVARLHARSRDAGVEMDLDMGAVFHLRDGRVASLRTYLDADRARRDAEGGAP